MASSTLVWRGLDEPRMEIAYAEVDGAELRARGTQIGVAYELRYELEPGRLRVELVGGPSHELELIEGTDFFDLGNSPLFNSLPILRDGLAKPRNYVMTWVAVPSLEATRSEQRYEPIRPGVVRYSGSHRPGMPYFDLELGDDGFVRLYPRLAERVA